MKKARDSRRGNFFSGSRKGLAGKLLKGSIVLLAGAVMFPLVALAFAGMGMSFPPISLNRMLRGKAPPGTT